MERKATVFLRKMEIIEYTPNSVKLPNNLIRDYICYNLKNEVIPREENEHYEGDIFFYDVFLDQEENYIWALGPPLYSLSQKDSSLKNFLSKKFTFLISFI